MGVYIPGMEMPTSCAECRFYGEYCYAKGDENKCSKLPCPLVPVPKHGEMANADRIRAMTDEELAWWISDVQYIQRDPAEWEMWLKSPVEVDDG